MLNTHELKDVLVTHENGKRYRLSTSSLEAYKALAAASREQAVVTVNGVHYSLLGVASAAYFPETQPGPSHFMFQAERVS